LDDVGGTDPRRQNSLYLAAMNSSFQLSTDGGETWQLPGTIPGEMDMSSRQPEVSSALCGRTPTSTTILSSRRTPYVRHG
jgi:hypothetical protein